MSLFDIDTTSKGKEQLNKSRDSMQDIVEVAL